MDRTDDARQVWIFLKERDQWQHRPLFIAVVDACFARVGDRFVEAAGDLTGQDALDAMGASYGEHLADSDRLRLQMQAYTASDDPDVRADSLSGLGLLGIGIDPERNVSEEKGARVISTGTSPVPVLVVPTNEELSIARQVWTLVAP